SRTQGRVGHRLEFLYTGYTGALWLRPGFGAHRCFWDVHQQHVELGRRLAPHTWQHVAVGVQGEGDPRVPKALLNDLGMHALSPAAGWLPYGVDHGTGSPGVQAALYLAGQPTTRLVPESS